MSLAATPQIPPSARGYSLQANVANALSKATEAVYGPDGAPTLIVHPLLLCHYFLDGMPEPGDEARELSSEISRGQLDSPLFSKIFHVPLPIDEATFNFSEAAEQATWQLVNLLNEAGQLPTDYKTDIIVFDQADQGTLKITQWHADDPRGETPHNHPWADEEGLSFISYIVRGGYTETITYLDGTTETRTYRAGDRNVARYANFHTVSDIQPGTLTILMCAPRAVVAEGDQPWGYIVFEDLNGNPLDTAELVGMNDPRTKDPNFLQRAGIMNPAPFRAFAYKGFPSGATVVND